jgi:hypothetical protein
MTIENEKNSREPILCPDITLGRYMSETPESNPSALVVSSSKALAIANRQLRIAGKALARIEQERYIEFFATHTQASRAFVEVVSRWYPCSEATIERYSGRWNWKSLSQNETLSWNEALIERYADRWNWEALSGNKALPWSEKLVERYSVWWNWEALSGNKALPWSERLIERFKDQWHWGVFGLSWSQVLPWSEPLIACYADQWDWEWLSWNRALPWSETLIERYANRWHWSKLSQNEGLQWNEALLLRYADRWNWECLSRNRVLPWSDFFLLRYEDRWEWGWLSRNEALPWSEGFLNRHAERWDWWALSLNEALPWSDALIERYAHRWNWLLLSQNQALPWTESLIKLYEDRWIWFSPHPDDSDLSGNPALPWSIALIKRYEDRWNWGENGLSTNTSLPWSDALIERFQARWNWDLLSWNEAIPWSETLIEMYADRWYWEKISEIAFAKILPTWSESSICAVMNRLFPSSGNKIYVTESATDLDLSAHDVSAIPELVSVDVSGLNREARRLLRQEDGWHSKPELVHLAGWGLQNLTLLGDWANYQEEMEALWYRLTLMAQRNPDAAVRMLAWIDDGPDAIQPSQLGPDLESAASLLLEQMYSLVQPREPTDNVGGYRAGDCLPDLVVSFPGGFDAEAYASAKPHFEAVWAATKAAGKDFKEFFAILIRAFGGCVKPYAIAFAKEIKARQYAESTQPETLQESAGSAIARSPEMIHAGIEMAGFYIEAGERRFVEVSRRLAEDLDVSLEQIKPFLQQWYNGAREFLKSHGYDVSDVDDVATAKAGIEVLFSDQASRKPRGPGSTEMKYKTDYGLRLMQDGISRDADHNFYDFRLYSLTVLAPGQYSTTVEMPFAGELHAVSLDFNQVQLDQILSHAAPQLASFIRNELACDSSSLRTIDFAGEVVFGVRARLGEIQRVERETFVPFVAQEII